MAVVKFTGLVDQIRGKIGGTVFSKFHSGYNSYSKGAPKRWGSTSQQLVRATLAQSANLWNTLTPEVRLDWAYIAENTPVINRLGETATLTAFAYFMKFTQMYLYSGLNEYPAPNTTLDDAYTFEIEPVSLDITGSAPGQIIDEIVIDHEILTTSPENNIFLYYIGLPMPRLDYAYGKTYFLIGTKTIASGKAPAATFQETFSNVQMPPAFYSQDGAFHSIMVKPLTVESAQFGPGVAMPIEAVFVPPPAPMTEYVISFPGEFDRYINLGAGAVVNQFNFYLRSTPELPGVASDYTLIWEAVQTIQLTDTSTPGMFSGSDPEYSEDPTTITPAFGTLFKPIPEAAAISFLNSNFTYSFADSNDYQPIRIKLVRKSDGSETAWAYTTLLIIVI